MVCKTKRHGRADAGDGNCDDGGKVRSLLGALGMSIEQQRCCRGRCCNQRDCNEKGRVSQRCGDIAKPQYASRREGCCGKAGKECPHARGRRGACRAEPKCREACGGSGCQQGVAG